MVTASTIAKIHIAKKELAMDDDSYRAMLQSIAGVASSKALTPLGAAKVLAHLERCGWKPKLAIKTGRRPHVTLSREALVAKIEAQLTEAKRPWAYVDAMAKRMFGVDKVSWLEPERLRKIVAALAYDAKRRGNAT